MTTVGRAILLGLEWLLGYVIFRVAAWAVGLDGDTAVAAAFTIASVNVLMARYDARRAGWRGGRV